MKCEGESHLGLPTERNSQVLLQQEPRMDTSLESPLSGRRRCTGNEALISQAKGQSL